ncbi:MAG: Nif3-like dinuclear metal center hexameric protein [Gammaproteobacteria bacterium]|nr:Nif3-like dinuclear metal center hexameric protein [Gammaproteobacteria bacterium]
MIMQLDELCHFCDDYLSINEYSDFCPNGLQIEGKGIINHLVTGVTASLELIDAAIEQNADAILVHHGYFWKGEEQPLTGYKGKRIKALMQNDISLLAYHLPLDFHPTVGNNAQLGLRMGWLLTEQQEQLWIGEVAEPCSVDNVLEELGEKIDTNPLLIVGGDRPVHRIAWCTGAAQSYLEQAAEQGVDLYISGEISEQTVHVAREMGIHYIAAGHHATERYGVQALGELLANRFSIYHEYIEIENPV